MQYVPTPGRVSSKKHIFASCKQGNLRFRITFGGIMSNKWEPTRKLLSDIWETNGGNVPCPY